MAQKVNIVLVDDIDGSEATQTVSFGLDGTTYEIDLNDANAASLRDSLAGYIGHGRKVGAAPRRSGRRSSGSANGSGSGPSAKEIRDWARANGHEVPDRGRVSAEVREAFDKAN
jgi:Lsr2